MAETQRLYPVSDILYEWTFVDPGAPRYAALDEYPFNDSDYCAVKPAVGVTKDAIFGMTTPPTDIGSIISVTLYARLSSNLATGTASAGFYIGSTFYPLLTWANEAFSEKTSEETVSPATSNPWTRTELDATDLQIRGENTVTGGVLGCSGINCVVTYNRPAGAFATWIRPFLAIASSLGPMEWALARRWVERQWEVRCDDRTWAEVVRKCLGDRRPAFA